MVAPILKWLSRLALISITGVLAFASLDQDALGMSDLIRRHADKALHVFAGYVITLFAILAFPRFSAWQIAGALTGLAVIAEGLQIGIGRSAHISDLVFSWLGILIAVIPFYAWQWRSERSN